MEPTQNNVVVVKNEALTAVKKTDEDPDHKRLALVRTVLRVATGIRGGGNCVAQSVCTSTTALGCGDRRRAAAA